MNRRTLSFLLAALVLVAWSPALMAHPGHGHKVMGTVASIQGNHVEVKDAAGKVTMHMLDAKTKIRRGWTVLNAADIKLGDRVVLSITEGKGADGKTVTTVTEVQVGPPPARTSGVRR